METSRRKKFCVSRRVEEYQYIESASEEEQNSVEDFASICKILHQKALKRSKQLEIEEKFKNEFQLREASFARLRNNQTSISSDDYSHAHSRSNSNLTNLQPNLITSTRRNDSRGAINKTSIREISNGYNNGYSSASSVISFSKAIIDEPEDIYLNHNNQSNVIKLDEYKLNEFTPSDQLRRSSLGGTKSRSSNSLGSLSFFPSERNDKRSTIIPPRIESPKKKNSISGRKSLTVKNSEIVSDVANSEIASEFSNLRNSRSKSLGSLSNATSKKQSRLMKSSIQSPSKSQLSNQSSKKSFRPQNSEILTNQLESNSSLKNSSTRKSRPNSEILSNQLESNGSLKTNSTRKSRPNSELLSNQLAESSSLKTNSTIKSRLNSEILTNQLEANSSLKNNSTRRGRPNSEILTNQLEESSSLKTNSTRKSRPNSEILSNQLEANSSLKNNSTRRGRKSNATSSLISNNNSAIDTAVKTDDEVDQLNKSILNQKSKISSRLSISRNSSTPKSSRNTSRSSKIIDFEDDEIDQEEADGLPYTNKSEIKSLESTASKQNTSVKSTVSKESTVNALPNNGDLVNKSAIDTIDEEDDNSLVSANKSKTKINSSIRSVAQSNIDEIEEDDSDKESPNAITNKSIIKSTRNSSIRSTRSNKGNLEENNESVHEAANSSVNRSKNKSIRSTRSNQEEFEENESDNESIDLPPLNDSEIRSAAPSTQNTSTKSTISSTSFNRNLVNKSAIETIQNEESINSLTSADKSKNKSLRSSFIRSEIVSNADEVEEDENDNEPLSSLANKSINKSLRNSSIRSTQSNKEEPEKTDEESVRLPTTNKSEIESIEPSTSKQDLSIKSTRNTSLLNKDQVNYSAIDTLEEISIASEIKSTNTSVRNASLRPRTPTDKKDLEDDSEKESFDLPSLNDSEIETYKPSRQEISTESSDDPSSLNEHLVNKSEIDSIECEESNSRTSGVESKNTSAGSTSQSNMEEEIEEDKESKLEISSDNESRSELKICSFSRIEPNFSNVSISFEPSINNSIENHLESQNEAMNSREKSVEQSSNEEQKKDDGHFKVPKLPLNKKQFTVKNQPIVKQQPKYYETMVNNTPTIIYPQQEQQKHDEEDEEDHDALVRRSSRIRVRPLEYWRNQKLKYKLDTATKCFTIEGVEKGFKPENPFSKKYVRDTHEQRGSNKRKLKQSKKKSKLPRIKEENQSSTEEENNANESSSSEDEEREPVKRKRYAQNEESIHVNINESALAVSERIKREAVEFYSKSDLVWNPSRAATGVFIALMNRKKSAKTGIQASGFIKLEPFAEKPRQTSSDYVTKYVVMFGAVSVQVGDKPTVFLKNMESFIVEKNTMYSIRNLRKDEALLYFDVTRTN